MYSESAKLNDSNNNHGFCSKRWCCYYIIFCLVFFGVMFGIAIIIFELTIDSKIEKTVFDIMGVESNDTGIEIRQRVLSQEQGFITQTAGSLDESKLSLIQQLYVIKSDKDDIFMQCYWNQQIQHQTKTVIIVSNPFTKSIPKMGNNMMQDMVYGFQRSTCFYDYSGNGYSSGNISEQKLYDNIKSVFYYLINQLNIDRKNIVFYGHSIGATVSIDVASKHRNIGGVILVAPFKSIMSFDKQLQIVPSYIPKFLPIVDKHDKFNSKKKISKILDPVLILRGKNDKDVLEQDSEFLVKQLQNGGNKNVTFVQVDTNLDFGFKDDAINSIFEQIKQFLQKNQLY